MKRRPVLETLTEALEWLKEAWEEREIPQRLHTSDFEGEGLFYAPAFARYLSARPDDTCEVTSTRHCQHPRLKGRDTWECPDCQGSGTFDSTTLVYRAPMWRAMLNLRRDNVRAHDRVLTLVINAYDVPGTLSIMAMREERLVDAIRSLHSRYRLAPEVSRWTEKSQSQQSAEMAVA